MAKSAASIRNRIAKGWLFSRSGELRPETSVVVNLVLMMAPFYGMLINGYKYGT
jgi:hypothetical protein